jgi:pyridoxal phosphate enzyme (YggS family)
MVAENVENVRKRIAAACARAGRSPDDITLIAVTKTFSAEHIREALRAGVNDIGENYVQEFQQKRETLEHENIRWHFIGHLQSNKVKYIIESTYLIHSVDSFRLGEEIAKRAAKCDRHLDILVEVNTTGEQTKSGVQPEVAAGLVKDLQKLSNVTVAGLMTIGPFLPDPEQSRPAFRLLYEVRQKIQDEIGIRLPHLSMGMTNDFEVAIEEGTTLVRIGTAIFGKRT